MAGQIGKTMEVTSKLVRKSLHTRLVEAAAAKDVTLEVAIADDGRIGYALTQFGVRLEPVTPGVAASMLGIPISDPNY